MSKLIFYLVSVFIGCESAKILGVFPTPSISHQVVFRPLMLELAKRGHEVIVITTDPAFPKGQAPENLTEIDVHDISYEYFKHASKQLFDVKDQIVLANQISDMMLTIVEKQYRTPEVQELLNSNKPIDLLFIESYVRPALVYSHKFNASFIEFSSLSANIDTHDNFGAASHPLYYPSVLQKRVNNLTLWEKMINTYTHYSVERILKQRLDKENVKVKQLFGSDVPDLEVLERNVQMVFLNVHPIWDSNRPVPPNIVYLGGMHQKLQQELPKDLKSYLDSSKNGVIYISFGTNVKPTMFPPEKLKIFTDVASKLSYDVLWKWDNDELPGRPNNVRISKWLPQSDLLRHPKIKLFITQGGLQSTDEAITAGVPLVGVPMIGDQWFNVEQYVKFHIGKQLSIETLTENQLMDAIKDVINDKSYRENIVKLRDIIHDQPQSPLQRAVWWTEHVLRHGGGAHLRAPAMFASWTEYYELELVLLVLAAIVLVLILSILTIYLIISKIRTYMRVKVKVN